MSDLAEIEERLRAKGLRTSPVRFIDEVLAAIDDVRSSDAASPFLREFTSAERDALSLVGVDLSPRRPGDPDPLVDTAAVFAGLLDAALTVTEAAGRLRVSTGRIRQRLDERTLYGVKLTGQWRLLTFQFTEAGLVPGVDVVLQALRPGLHPVALWTWFTRPYPDLEVDDEPVGPRQWLVSGGDPHVAAAIAADL